MLLAVGGWTENTDDVSAEAEGLRFLVFQRDTGEVKLLFTAGLTQPTFVTTGPANSNACYVTRECTRTAGAGVGAFQVVNLPAGGYDLQELGYVEVPCDEPCHLTVSPDSKSLFVACYGSGNLLHYALEDSGKIGELRQNLHHQGSGPNPQRQESPHAHCTIVDSKRNLLYQSDLGTDRIYVYQIGPDGLLTQRPEWSVSAPAGSGPRHFCPCPQQEFLFLISELKPLVSVYRLTATGPQEHQHLTYLASASAKGSAITASHDGFFVYAGERSENIVAVFEFTPATGRLSLIERVDTRGDIPRDIILSPDGEWLIVANQNSHDLSFFRRDIASGRLQYSHRYDNIGSPAGLWWVGV